MRCTKKDDLKHGSFLICTCIVQNPGLLLFRDFVWLIIITAQMKKFLLL